MKAGDVVAYVKGKARTTAEVVAHTGSGSSGWKTLTLRVGGKLVKDVPNVRDKAGKGHWDEHAVPESEVVASAPVVPEAKAKGRATAGVGRKRAKKRK